MKEEEGEENQIRKKKERVNNESKEDTKKKILIKCCWVKRVYKEIEDVRLKEAGWRERNILGWGQGGVFLMNDYQEWKKTKKKTHTK